MGESGEIQWRRPERCSGESTCVEVAFASERVLVRNSEEPDGAVAAFSRAEWAAFVAAVKADEFNS
jgi:hypothetical protein